jgi:hypothetical protein
VGEVYAYVPKTENNRKQLTAVPPRSIENPDYGFSVGRGSFTIQPGKWIAIATRVKAGVDDGSYEYSFVCAPAANALIQVKSSFG